METVNIQAAKTQLSRLVNAAAASQKVIIARAGKPAASCRQGLHPATSLASSR